LEDEVPPIWPTYIGQKITTLGKVYGIKSVVVLGVSWGTLWELDVNTLGTNQKNPKIQPPKPSPKDF
jgi:hypothetical protein